MSKQLILAEKPSVGKEIARVLNCKKNINGGLEGQTAIVTWAFGHLVELASPERYDEKYKSWIMSDLPMLPAPLRLEVIPKSKKQFYQIKKMLSRSDVTEVVIATDAGREGELVARWILKLAGCRKPVKRLWISSQTDKAITDGFKNLKPGKEYLSLYEAAQARAESDWYLGLNLTRALTCKYNAQLSAGRVQTPTLAMVVAKEEEIQAFRSRPFWRLSARHKGVSYAATQSRQIFDKAQADQKLNQARKAQAKVTAVDRKVKSVAPPQLYDLTSLQIEANKRYGMGAKQTLRSLQNLYERHKLVTYPRTDSRVLTSDLVATLPERLEALKGGPMRKEAQYRLKKGVQVTKRLVDDKRVSDHHALIPTEATIFLSDLSNDERRIYDLIVTRFLEAVAEPAQMETWKVKVMAGKEEFAASFTSTLELGWKAIAGDDKQDAKPDVKAGQILDGFHAQLREDRTQPPERYTEATLLRDMENPKRFVKDEALRKTLDQAGGIGTVATRADILDKLYHVGYFEDKNGHIFPTSKGRQLIELVPDMVKSPALTAKWEGELTRIQKENIKRQAFINEIKEKTRELVKGVEGSEAKYRHDNQTNTPCPDCGKRLLRVKGKHGERLVCPDRECGYKRNVSRTTNARCPQCHKKLVMMGEGDKKYFKCNTCGFRESLASWEKKNAKKKQQMNKREAQRYMKKQKKQAEEPMNNAFADALKNFKFDDN
jgi:DNA topoisomerase-3